MLVRSSSSIVPRTFLTIGFLLAALALAFLAWNLAYAQTPDSIEYAENGTDAVATYVAVDPEGASIVWSLTGTDAGDFTITNGVLAFKSSPDYENPIDRDTDESTDGVDGDGTPTNDPDHGFHNNAYLVTVRAGDGGATTIADKAVTVTVTNVDEPGTVTLSTLQPQLAVQVTATLTDPDGSISGTTWQWSRSEDGSSWADIEGAATVNYTPTQDVDDGKYLRATASYSSDKTASAVSAHKVRLRVTNDNAPAFQDSSGADIASVDRSVAENTPAGGAVGDPVVATDDAWEVLTYTLADTVTNSGDAASFDIDETNGQISVGKGVTLNADTGGTLTYAVTVSAADPFATGSNDTDTKDSIAVTITVTDVDEDPSVTGDATAGSHAENTVVTTTVLTFTATDPESGTLTWGLSGDDAGDFNIAAGRLTFKELPNFESPADADTNNIYEVTVVVTDSGANTDEAALTVKVTDVNEAGTVTLDTLQPRIGFPTTASLEDVDGGISGVTWQWGRSVADNPGTLDVDDDTDTVWTDIQGATSPAYTPVAADLEKALRAVAKYTDNQGGGKSARVASANNVEEDATNKAPEFPDQSEVPGEQNDETTRSVLETAGAGDFVGNPVEADDANGDTLTYTLGGDDAASFDIDVTDGRISVKDGTSLDTETKSVYVVTVTAEDPGKLSSTIKVNIIVTDVDEAPSLTGEATIDYAENGTDAVATYVAVDPEGALIVWSLGGDDEGDFSITNGVLAFNSPPDFEAAADADTNNAYLVTVRAGDGGATTIADKAVTVTVTNVDEPGTVTLSTLQPQLAVQVTATLTDPDGSISGTTWQWSRSEDGSSWADIEGAATVNYTPTQDVDDGKYLRATASYSSDKTASAVSAHKVRLRVTNDNAPAFQDSSGADIASVDRSVAENTPAGGAVGDPVVATDDAWEVLTYKLADTVTNSGDAASFDIDETNGQISVGKGVTLNADTGGTLTYAVTVSAADPFATGSNDTDTKDSIAVTITVTDVDEDPSVTGDATAGSHAENTVVTTTVLTFTATDPESGTLTWGLSGDDAGDFNIAAGRLTFKELPNFESPADADTNNIYEVTVVVTDSGANTDEAALTVKVTDVNEAGTVTLFPLQPRIGFPTTASLEDVDGGISGVTWQWGRSVADNPGTLDVDDDTDTVWTDIQGATSPAYTPVAADLEKALRAVAKYTDNQGGGKSARVASANNVEEDATNKAPEFPDQSEVPGEQNDETTRSVLETAGAGDFVGNPVEADDANGDTLTYTLGGDDAASFDINSASGQISVKAGTSLDTETKSTYVVTVTATDPGALSSTIKVNIMVTDVDEAPDFVDRTVLVTGPLSVMYAENNTGSVATYTASGPEAAGATWSVTGTDAGDFTITDGVLAFRSSPDYETPADNGGDNEYMITVMATGATQSHPRDVNIRVTNAEEAGTVTLSSTSPAVGAELMASLTDPDGGITGTTWQWASSDAMDGSFTDISRATSAAYTPLETDAGMYLRAMAMYTDGHDAGKSQMVVTANAVVTGAAPVFDPDTIERTVANGATEGTNVGAPVTATDADGDNLTYSLGGADAASFAIDSASGQITVATGVTLDAATKDTYTVEVTATDPTGATGMVDVTITVGTGSVIGDRYDTNPQDGMIDGEEALDAVVDYFDGNITSEQLLDVLVIYFG